MAVSVNIVNTKNPRASSLFVVEGMEGLLHGFSKLLPEVSWIEAEKFLVKGVNRPLSIRHVQNFR